MADIRQVISSISVNTQSSIRIDIGQILYIDPFKIEETKNDANVIFITHDHYDHYSPEDIKKVRQRETQFVCPESMREELLEAGIAEEKITAVKPGDALRVIDIPVEAVAAYNPAKKFHPKDNGWVGYVLTIDGIRIYACGDTDVTPEAEAVRCDILLTPIGGTYTMTREEAAGFVNHITPQVVIPIHYGSIVGSPDDVEAFEGLVDPEIEVVRRLSF